MTRKAWAAVFLVLLIAACIALIAWHWEAQETRQFTYASLKPLATMLPIAWPEGLVNVNTADALELETLDGLNQAQIEALLKDRVENGAFDFPEDLVYVKGIGEKTLAKIWDQLDFSWRIAGN
jgi:competence ComEA-like helix-hairpin-helix protein